MRLDKNVTLAVSEKLTLQRSYNFSVFSFFFNTPDGLFTSSTNILAKRSPIKNCKLA